jgi:thiosulfate reductase cytochrome b subunit
MRHPRFNALYAAIRQLFGSRLLDKSSSRQSQGTLVMAGLAVKSKPRDRARLHPLPVRLMHWINAIAMVIMIGSGWKIYNDSVIFSWLRFSDVVTLGGDPDIALKLHGNGGQSGALQWHFLGMWILVINGLAYVVYGLHTGRFRRMLFPIRRQDLLANIADALRFRLKHDDLLSYNAVQKALYVGIIAVGIIQVLAGLALWKPVQFSWLLTMFYDFQGARVVHFLAMAAIVMFMLVHVTLSLLVPRSLVAMVTGGPRTHASQMPTGMAPQIGE